MQFKPVPVWKEAPFLRLLIPFTIGVLAQWLFEFPGFTGTFGTIFCTAFLLAFALTKTTLQFERYWLHGIFLNGLMLFTGITLAFFKDAKRSSLAITSVYADSALLVVKIDEPLVPKPNSYKAIATIQTMHAGDSVLFPKGKVIIYFEKQHAINRIISYGTQICFRKTLQPIKNAGNPGAFDYKQYCAFQGMYYQVYLRSSDYTILASKEIGTTKQILFTTTAYILDVLRKYIPGRKEAGLAEALLIGYKEDLDKALVQSYSNTGVVHVIAISGLHVGLIYWLLAMLLQPLVRRKGLRFLKPVLIIIGLWMFSILAGASPSVLRSAVMFTFIVIGQSFSRKISIYNSLAASAFLLLCYNPFWVWDVGFQLSYAAVLSIVIFMKPIYNLWFIENKILDAIWKLNTVTISAQILTLPICLYYFHQFPNFFLVTNLLAVPLSSLILLGELLLFAVSPITAMAEHLGWLLYWSIWLMNTFIERIDRLPFSVTGNIQVSLGGLICLYIIIACLSIWLLKKINLALIGALAGVFMFGIVTLQSRWIVTNQRKLIVYSISRHQAIDFIEGRNHFFVGDTTLLKDEFLMNFYLKPARIHFRATQSDSLASLFPSYPYFVFDSKTIAIITGPVPKTNSESKLKLDIGVISKNPTVSIAEITNIFSCKTIVFDASNSSWKITQWKKQCDRLKLPYYSVAEKGAFVMSLN